MLFIYDYFRQIFITKAPNDIEFDFVVNLFSEIIHFPIEDTLTVRVK